MVKTVKSNVVERVVFPCTNSTAWGQLHSAHLFLLDRVDKSDWYVSMEPHPGGSGYDLVLIKKYTREHHYND